MISRALGRDIRNEGSHNSGASNALRVLGTKIGLLTFAGDCLKAVCAVLIGKGLAGDNGGLIAGLFVVIGHNWPVFFRFKGGKGIACSVGIVLTMFPLYGGIAVLCGIGMIAWTKYISVGSLTILSVFSVLMLIFKPIWPYFIWALVLTGLAFYRHRTNIARLHAGKENKISFKKK